MAWTMRAHGATFYLSGNLFRISMVHGLPWLQLYDRQNRHQVLLDNVLRNFKLTHLRSWAITWSEGQNHRP